MPPAGATAQQGQQEKQQSETTKRQSQSIILLSRKRVATRAKSKRVLYESDTIEAIPGFCVSAGQFERLSETWSQMYKETEDVIQG